MQNKKVETFVSTFLFVLNEVLNRQRLAEAGLNNARLILAICLSGTSQSLSTIPSIRLTIRLSWS